MTAISASSVREKADRFKKRDFYLLKIVNEGRLTPTSPPPLPCARHWLAEQYIRDPRYLTKLNL